MNSKLLLTLAGLATAGSLSAQTLIFSENFGTLANGTAITTANTTFNYARVSTGASPLLAAQNPSTIGTGSSALLQATTTSLTGLGYSGFSPFTAGVLNFTLQAPTTQGTFFFALGTGATFTGNTTFSTGDLTAGFQFTSAGQLQVRSSSAFTNVGTTTITAGTTNALSVVFNSSGSSYNYSSGALTGSVPNNTADIYINGTLVADNVAINAAQASANAFRLYTVSGAANNPYQVDDVSVSSFITIPEPSTVALGVLGLAGMMALRRRRN